ncbi:MAG: aldo/keto reductase [Acidobacteriota bacterium]|nr:aldo/keto reductase [Acidobacteriota bacterium]
MLIPGHATHEGTGRFRRRFDAKFPGHFREIQGLWLSSIGIGTYLGEPTAACDALYRDAVADALELGINVIDTAVNYRHQRSERAIAQALAALISSGIVQRDEIVVATKGGFLTFDGSEPDDPSEYFKRTLIDTGLLRPDDVAAGCHAMSPKYLENQIDVSRRNLGLETLDIYYLHNPETQSSTVSREEFERRLYAAFSALEKAVGEGKIHVYGTATWNGYRVGQESREALSLPDLLRVAEQVGGKDHHFRAIQLPYNLAMPEALSARTQRVDGKAVPVLQVARKHGMMVFASASLLEQKLTSDLPEETHAWFPGLEKDAQRAIQFVRSTPGIACALVGMSKREHVAANLSTAQMPPLNLEQFRAIFGQ